MSNPGKGPVIKQSIRWEEPIWREAGEYGEAAGIDRTAAIHLLVRIGLATVGAVERP